MRFARYSVRRLGVGHARSNLSGTAPKYNESFRQSIIAKCPLGVKTSGDADAADLT